MWLWLRKIMGNLTVDDLPVNLPDIDRMRSNASILIIDDEPLVYEDGLRKTGFNIQIHNQWQDLRDVKEFQIVITDNQNVAPSFGAGCLGIELANQAKKMYPEKKYVVYSGNLIDLRGKNNIYNFPVLTKGDRLEDWIRMLDEAITNSYSPRKSWEDIEGILKEYGLSEKEKRKMQHEYVKALLLKSEKSIEKQGWSLNKETVSIIVRIAGLAISTMRLIKPL